MKTQIIQDHNGVPTGVFIPIEEWKKIQRKYPDIGAENLKEDFVLSDEQKETLDSRADKGIYRDVDLFFEELEGK